MYPHLAPPFTHWCRYHYKSLDLRNLCFIWDIAVLISLPSSWELSCMHVCIHYFYSFSTGECVCAFVHRSISQQETDILINLTFLHIFDCWLKLTTLWTEQLQHVLFLFCHYNYILILGLVITFTVWLAIINLFTRLFSQPEPHADVHFKKAVADMSSKLWYLACSIMNRELKIAIIGIALSFMASTVIIIIIERQVVKKQQLCSSDHPNTFFLHLITAPIWDLNPL